MKTLDNGIRFIRSFYVKNKATKEEIEQLDSELQIFKESVANESIIEQQAIFYEKFGKLMEINLLKQKRDYLGVIKKTLKFFEIVLSIAIVIFLLYLFLLFLGVMII